jgi:hypothetical protein
VYLSQKHQMVIGRFPNDWLRIRPWGATEVSEDSSCKTAPRFCNDCP